MYVVVFVRVDSLEEQREETPYASGASSGTEGKAGGGRCSTGAMPRDMTGHVCTDTVVAGNILQGIGIYRNRLVKVEQTD